MIHSITDKLMTLDDNTIVYPGMDLQALLKRKADKSIYQINDDSEVYIY